MSISTMFTKMIAACGIVSMLGTSAFAAEQNNSPKAFANGVTFHASSMGSSAPEDKLLLRLCYVHADKHTWYHNGHSSDAVNSRGGTQRNVHDRVAIRLAYGLGDGYTLLSVLPIAMNVFSGNSLTPKGVKSKCSIGDGNIRLQKQFLNQSQGDPFNFSLVGGVFLPTGDTSSDGTGSGAWGLTAGFGAGYYFDGGRQHIGTDIVYWYRGVGHSSRIDVSDTAVGAIRYTYALNDVIDLGLETTLEYNTESSLRGVSNEDANTAWFAGPTLSVKVPSLGMVLGFSAQFSLYQDYDAYNRQLDCPTAASLGEKVRFEATLYKMF